MIIWVSTFNSKRSPNTWKNKTRGLLSDVALKGNYSWIHKEKLMLQYSLLSSNFSLAEVTHLNWEVWRTPGQMSCCHMDSAASQETSSSAGRKHGGDRRIFTCCPSLRAKSFWTAGKQLYFPESHNPDLSPSEIQAPAFLKRQSPCEEPVLCCFIQLLEYSHNVGVCLPLPLPLCIRNPPHLLLHLVWDHLLKRKGEDSEDGCDALCYLPDEFLRAR